MELKTTSVKILGNMSIQSNFKNGDLTTPVCYLYSLKETTEIEIIMNCLNDILVLF